MPEEKKILFIYDYNLFSESFGTKKRFFSVLKNLRSRGYLIHQVSFDIHGRQLLFRDAPWNSSLIEKRFWLYRPPGIEVIKDVLRKILPRYCVIILKRLFLPEEEKEHGQGPVNYFRSEDRKINKKFLKLLGSEEYSIILASYCYFAPYVKDLGNIKKVLFIEDVLSTQLIEHHPDILCFETLFEQEVEAVNHFDEALCISPEELNLFASRARSPRYHYLPPIMERGVLPEGEDRYDFVFIGFDNEHNRTSLEWLMEEVFPRLTEFSIVIAGRAGRSFNYTSSMAHVSFIPYCDDLSRLYRESRVALCPMFSGTGVKIKVVEALSYGRPVLCTEKGAIGLPGDFEEEGILVRNDPVEFAAAAVKLCRDDEFYQAQSLRGSRYFDRYFTEETANEVLDRIF